MSDILALSVYIIDVKDNFVHLHRKYLNQFRNSRNNLGLIKVETCRTRYASCSGIAFNSNGENAFNVSATFAKTLNVEESNTVVISNFPFVQSLRMVFVSPISVDDLFILEDRSEAIQETLLSQMRIIAKHQKLTFWVSKSVSAQVHVDKLDNDLTSGKLEEHTEVVVSSNISACTDCDIVDVQSNKSSTWGMLKNIFAFGKPVVDDTIKETAEFHFISEGIFRCTVVTEDIIKFDKRVPYFPYNAFISSRHCVQKTKDCSPVYRLTHLPYVPPDGTNEVREKNPDSLSKQVFVQLYEIHDDDVLDKLAYHQISSYPTIFVTKSIFYSLRLRKNSKVKLEYVKYKNKCKPTQIDFTTVKGETDEANLIHQIKDLFKAPLHQGLLNNGQLIALNDSCETLIFIHFNPISHPFIELSEPDLLTIDLRATPRELDLKLDVEVPDETALLPFNFQLEILREIRQSLLVGLRLLRPAQNDDRNHVENSYHSILEGDVGTGKTSMMTLLKETMQKSPYQVFFKRLECKMLKGKLISKLEKVIRAALIECLCYEPAVLCLDDLDVLFAASKHNTEVKSEPSVTSYSNRLAHMLYDLFFKYSKYRITILATVRNCSSLESRVFQVRGNSLFSHRVVIPVMDQLMRRECFTQFFSLKPNLVYMNHMTELIRRTEGFCVQDLSDLVEKLYFEVLKRYAAVESEEFEWILRQEDVEESFKTTLPLSLVGVNLHKNPSVSWKDVGGLETAKRILREILIWPSQFPKIFNQSPLTLQSGVLLYGVPGSGKTLLAGAVAGEAGLNFIPIKGPELLSKFVGESEQGIRDTFQKARNAKPCILFFDEFDSLAPRRGNDITGVTDRVVNQLLTELDGVESAQGVWVLAATSRPDLIDPALLRPGRLGTIVHCPLPNEEERYSILKIMSGELPETEKQIDWYAIAAITIGYTGADLKAMLCTAATMNDTTKLREIEACLMRKVESSSLSDNDKDSEMNTNKIDTQCLLTAVEKTAPALKYNDLLFYQMLYEKFEGKNEQASLPVEQKVMLA